MWLLKISPNSIAKKCKEPCIIQFQGVIKHIIPAVASTNAVIAAAMALETFKILSGSAKMLDNYMVFNQTDSIYTYAYAVIVLLMCLFMAIISSSPVANPISS